MILSVFNNWWERASDLWECGRKDSPDDRSATPEQPLIFNLIDGKSYKTTDDKFFSRESYHPDDKRNPEHCETVTLYIGDRCVTFDVASIVSIEW